VSSSQDDAVPHIIVRLSHLQLGKFLIGGAKRLLQQNLPITDSGTAANGIINHLVSTQQEGLGNG
jgi:hypothetical protein